MRIALDAMGGDDAPRTMVQGAVDYALGNPEHQVVLVGVEDQVRREFERETGNKQVNVDIRHAPEVIAMGDKISALKEKRDDSMNTCARMVRSGEVDAMVLCGNTACSVAAAQLHLGRIRGVKRAGILTPLPNTSGITWICDAGANSTCRPEQLLQFATMTAAYLKCMNGPVHPRVGVLSIGSEDTKGDNLTAETLALLRRTDLNIIGNVEGNDIYNGTVDIVVCDGFTGNVVLKCTEGMAGYIRKLVRRAIRSSLFSTVAAPMLWPAMRNLRRQLSWAKVGGCLLLGVDGICIIGHGRSPRHAIVAALDQARRCVEAGVLSNLRHLIQDGLAANGHPAAAAN